MIERLIDPSVASVASVVTWPQALLCGGGGMCIKLLSGISLIARRCFTILSTWRPFSPRDHSTGKRLLA